MSFCKDCTSGVRHEGTPEGTFEEINGIKTYVATPKCDYPKDKAVIYITDIFGHELNNNLLLMSDFARHGCMVYSPDLFEGEPVPQTAFDPGSNYDLYAWLPRHTPEHTLKRVRKVIDGLKERGVTTFGVTGYCYGARLGFDLAFDNTVQAVAVAHPFAIQPKDFDIYIEKSKAPLLMNTCEFDELFPVPLAEKADEKFANFAPGYKRVHFKNIHHGFATRGDLTDPAIQAAKNDAFTNTREWFRKYLDL